MQYGYVRTEIENEKTHVAALKRADCDFVFAENLSAPNALQQKRLGYVLSLLKSGDTLAVWSMEALGLSATGFLFLLESFRERRIDFISLSEGINTETIMGKIIAGHFVKLARLERAKKQERIKTGMKTAKKRGQNVGRPRKLSEAQIMKMKADIEAGKPRKAIASALGVSTATLRRMLQKA